MLLMRRPIAILLQRLVMYYTNELLIWPLFRLVLNEGASFQEFGWMKEWITVLSIGHFECQIVLNMPFLFSLVT